LPRRSIACLCNALTRRGRLPNRRRGAFSLDEERLRGGWCESRIFDVELLRSRWRLPPK
jgi:hypothetical protein